MKVLLLLLIACACGAVSLGPKSVEADSRVSLSAAEWESLSNLRGRAVYERWCAGCHDPELQMNAGTRRIAERSGEDRAVIVGRTDLTKTYIESVVRDGLLMMPPFRPSEISAAELDALANFVVNGELNVSGSNE